MSASTRCTETPAAALRSRAALELRGREVEPGDAVAGPRQPDRDARVAAGQVERRGRARRRRSARAAAGCPRRPRPSAPATCTRPRTGGTASSKKVRHHSAMRENRRPSRPAASPPGVAFVPMRRLAALLARARGGGCLRACRRCRAPLAGPRGRARRRRPSRPRRAAAGWAYPQRRLGRPGRQRRRAGRPPAARRHRAPSAAGCASPAPCVGPEPGMDGVALDGQPVAVGRQPRASPLPGVGWALACCSRPWCR